MNNIFDLFKTLSTKVNHSIFQFGLILIAIISVFNFGCFNSLINVNKNIISIVQNLLFISSLFELSFSICLFLLAVVTYIRIKNKNEAYTKSQSYPDKKMEQSLIKETYIAPIFKVNNCYFDFLIMILIFFVLFWEKGLFSIINGKLIISILLSLLSLLPTTGLQLKNFVWRKINFVQIK